MTPLALVTGATGLVGTHVVQRLQQDGWQVRALVRDAARAGALSRQGIELATGDLLEPTGLLRAARGCDVVFHTAAAVTPHGGWESFERPNVNGTRNIVAAAAAANARLVHVSSGAVYGSAERYSANNSTSEETPLADLPESAFYARSKRASEDVVLQAHAAGTLWATAVRPCVIYGRNDRQFVPRLARLVRFGVVPVVGGGRSRLPVVHAANVADGMVRAARSDIAGGRAYNLTNDFDVTLAEFMRYAAEGLRVRVRLLPIPYAIAKAGMSAFQLVAPLLLGSRFNAVTSGSLDFMSRDNPFTSDRARRELGWNPAVRPETGVVDSFRWWAEHG